MKRLLPASPFLKFRLRYGSVAVLFLLCAFNPAQGAPAITNLSPARQMLNPGQTLNLGVTASGAGSLTYVWMRNGHVLAGITGSTYSTATVTYQDAGYYLVDVTDAGGTTRSKAFFVLVAPLATQVVAEGFNPANYQPVVVPAGLNDVVAASAGYWHTLLLRANGTLASLPGLGDGLDGVTDIPTGLDEVVAVAAGTEHSLALRADGTVVGWGDNAFGEISVPSGLRDVVAIAANQYRSVALRSDGTVIIWGGPSLGGTTVIPAGLNHVAAITAELALKADGTVVALDSPSTPAAAGWTNIISISSSQAAEPGGYGVKSDGTVLPWGAYTTPPPSGLTGVIAVSCGNGEEVALKSDGTVVHWPLPSDLTGLVNVFAVTSGSVHAVYLRDITGNPAPIIATQPADRTVVAGGTAVFSVTASGNPAPTYQWKKNGANLAGATGSSYVIANTTALDAGTYTVVVSNSLGSVTSNAAQLTVSPVPSDFNGDGVTDVMLENQSTGQRTLWLMGGPNGQYVNVGLDMGLLDPSWHIAVVADFNGDGHPDILLESSVTGQRILWFMGGPNGQYVAFAVEIAILDPVWHIVGAADFDHDGHLDLLVENRTTGQRVLWLMQGADGPYTTVDLGVLDPVWQIVAATDFNADGHPDILLENTVTGQRVLWLMGGPNGQYVTLGLDLGFLDPAWHIVGAREFNGDGHPDILLENTVSGQRVLWLMGGNDSQYVTLGLGLGLLDPAWHIVH